MKANIVRIGNSRGIRIPQPILEECGIGEEVDLRVEKKRIILEPVKTKARTGWSEQFKTMHEHGEDKLLLPEGIDASVKDWQW